MAEQVARLKILAQIEGLEGFDKLKGAFKGLQQAIGPSDDALSKARKEILAFGEAGGKTEQVIRGQVEALKALQSQATISGGVYRQLGKDIKELGNAYKQASTGVKQFSDASLKSQKPGAKQSTFAPQIQAFKRELDELSVYSRQYGEKLTEIKRRQMPFDLATGRQGVIAAFEAYRQGPDLANAATRMPEMPDTTAALKQRMGELGTELNNVARGGEDWVRVQREIIRLQRELNRTIALPPSPELQVVRDRLADSRRQTSRTGNGFLNFSRGAEERVEQQAEAERVRRQTIYSQPIGPASPTELMRSVNAAFGTSAANQAQLMGRSYQEVASSIRQASVASDGSVVSLRAQRAAWEALRDTLGNNKAALKEVNSELANVDRQLDRKTGGSNALGNRFQTLGAIASGAVFGGPAGFLGAAGGAAYGARSGIGSFSGALGGAAAGAAVGGVGMAAAGASNYASEIARLQIALKGVSTDQGEFNNSLKFIKDSAPQFLTSLGDATKNYTRLQASVRGAGMGVNDTQTVFKGLSAAIVATGGGTEQLNAAMLAASQVFSKGKVSAEELRGQIGERLPGAFTIFAQAVNMTPQQLDKALQDGKVTTEQFVKFSEELFKRYGDAAKAIGDSPFAASIRFQLAMDNFRLAAGQALLPIITAFQNFGTEAFNSLTRVAEGTTGWQKALGNTFSNVSRLIGGVQGLKDILSGLTKTLIVLGTTMAGVFAVQNIGTFTAILKTAFLTMQGFVRITRELLTLEKAITALKAIQASLQAFISTAGSSIKKNAKGIAGGALALGAGGLAVYQFREQIDGAISGVVDSIGGKFNDLFKMPELGGNFGGQATPVPPGADENSDKIKKEADEKRRLDEANARARVDLDNAIHRNAMELIKKRFEYEQELQNKQRDNWVKTFTGAAKSAASLITSFYGEMDGLTNRRREAAFDVSNAQQAAKSAQAVAAATGGSGISPTGIIARTGNTGDSTGPHLDARWADGRPISAADADQYLMVNGRSPSSYGVTSGYGPRSLFGRSFHRGVDFGTPSGSGVSLKGGATFLRDLGFTGAGGYAVEIQTADGPMRLLHLQGGSTARTTASAAGNASQQARSIGAEAKSGVEAVDLAGAERILKLTEEQVTKLREQIGTGFVRDYTQQVREQLDAQKDANFELEYRNKLEQSNMRSEFVDAQLRKSKAAREITQSISVANQALETLEKNEKGNTAEANRLREAIQALVLLYPQLSKAIDDNAKKQAEAADRAKSFNGSLGNSLRSYYKELSDFGGQVGGAILNTFKGLEDQLVSFVTTGKANFAELARSILADMARIAIKQAIIKPLLGAVGGLFNIPLTANANGNAFAQNGIVPFAQGGIVNSPTLFKFANGGAGQLGLMGEAGPEAIMPLRRGRDGKLGVAAASGGGNTNVTVNVDASGGSQVQGNPGQAEQLGRAVSQAVQAELIRQRRPGGLLAA